MIPITDPERAFVAAVGRFMKLAVPAVHGDCWRETLMTHRAFPNLLSVIEAARVAGLECEAVRGDAASLEALSRPSLLYIPAASGQFAVLEEVRGERVLWTHPDSGRQWTRRDVVAQAWNGIALTVAGTGPMRCGRRSMRAAPIVIALGVLGSLMAATAETHQRVLLAAVVVLNSIGAAVSFLIDREDGSALSRALCPAGGVFDCRRVLDSRAATMFGIPLSEWSAAYFMVGVVSMLMGAVHGSAAPVISLWAWISIATLPIVIASIIYQAVVLRAWCAGCLTIDGALLLQTAVLWTHRRAAEPNAIRIVALGAAIAAIMLVLRDSSTRIAQPWRWRYARLKRNPAVLAALLADAPMMTPAYHSPRITTGGEDATIDVMISTSPYCVACAALHRALQSEAIRSRVTFAFYCDPEQDVSGVRMLIAAHALEHEGRTAESWELLDSWFDALHERRSFDESRVQELLSTLPGESLERARASMREQYRWNVAAGITATPRILIEGHFLPPQYELADLASVDLGDLAGALRRFNAPSAVAARSTGR